MDLAGARGAARTASAAGRTAARRIRHTAFPPTHGALGVRGVHQRVEVVRDRWGVPHVRAASAQDALFGHGFVHAQDRLFQMEGARRLAGGRLSEVTGPGSLTSDRFMRCVGLARAARRDAVRIEGEVAALLQAYARGVNEGVRHLHALPPEFALLGDTFDEWRVEDTLLIGRLIMFGFAGNWNTELVRERLAAALGPEIASAVDPVHPPTPTATGLDYPGTAARLLESYRALVEAGLPAVAGSNAWAVTSARTTTGAPLLAADPHVDSTLPGIFHVAHVTGGDMDAIGAGIAGIPGVTIGHNRHIAWGVTAGMADVSDCYIEDFDPAAPRRYRTPEGWAEAEEIVEHIAVRGASAVEERVLVTRHGPVVSPALPGESRGIALRSSVVEGGDIATPFLALGRAGSLEAAERAIDVWPGTTFNFILASTEDRVGYRFGGQVPQRQPGEGLLPQRGARSPGPPPFIPADALPRAIDPPSGVVVSANNAPGGAELELGEEWAEPRRAERIRALVEARERHDVPSFASIQNDRHSANLARLRDLLLAHGIEGAPDIASLLRAWDGSLEEASPAAAIVSQTYRTLAAHLAERLAGPLARTLLGLGVEGALVNSAFAYRQQGAIVTAAERATAPWFLDADDRDRQLRAALARATSALREASGDDPAAWTMRAIQYWQPKHPLSTVPGLGRLFAVPPRPFGGDVNTVVQAQTAPWPRRARVAVAPGYRQVVDLADWDGSVFMLPSGNSGIPGHPRYDDCTEEYVAGHYRPLLFSTAAIDAAAEARLMLEPEPSA